MAWSILGIVRCCLPMDGGTEVSVFGEFSLLRERRLSKVYTDHLYFRLNRLIQCSVVSVDFSLGLEDVRGEVLVEP